MNICLAKPNKRCSMETFVNNHVKYLKPSEVISLGYYPVEFENRPGTIFSGLLANPFIRGVLKNTAANIFHAQYANALSRYLKDHHIDVVLAEYGLVGANITDACRKSQTPLVTIFHGFDAFEHSILKKYADKYSKMFNYASAIIAVSKAMKKQLISLGAPENKVHWNPCGIDCNIFTPGQAERDKITRFIFIGRLAPKKAPDLLIRSFIKMSHASPESELVIAGDGVMKTECEELILQAGMQGRIKLLGSVAPDRVPELLRTADVYVQHSITSPNGDSEGTPNSILEASATALPVVSTFHGGIPDIVQDKKTGLLVQEKDVDGMAACMERLSADSNLRQQMGRNGRTFICDNFSLDKTVEKIRYLLKQAASDRS